MRATREKAGVWLLLGLLTLGVLVAAPAEASLPAVGPLVAATEREAGAGGSVTGAFSFAEVAARAGDVAAALDDPALRSQPPPWAGVSLAGGPLGRYRELFLRLEAPADAGVFDLQPLRYDLLRSFASRHSDGRRNPETRVRAFELPEPPSRLGLERASLDPATGFGLRLAETSVGPTKHGLWTDPVSGFGYARARWLDHRNASWLSEDPAGTVDSTNLYAYVAWSPQSSVDPLGLEAAVGKKGHFVITNPETGHSRVIRHDWAKEHPSGVWFALTEEAGLSEDDAAALIKKGNIPLIPGYVPCRPGETCIGAGPKDRGAAYDAAVRLGAVPVCGIAGLDNAVRRVIQGPGSEIPCAIGPPQSERQEEMDKAIIMLGLVAGATPRGGLGRGVIAGRGVLAGEGEVLPVGRYGTLSADLRGTGLQSNHLNQDAAFRSIIPTNEGIAAGMRGNAFSDVGSQHFNFHGSLEGFWSQYRRGGSRFGQMPTNAEYGQALEQALRAGGVSDIEAQALGAMARSQRAAYGLSESAPVPNIPGRINQSQ